MSHLKPRIATVPIFQGDDIDQLAYLRRKVEVAERIAEEEAARVADGASTRRLGDDDTDSDAAQAFANARREYDAFLEEAEGRTLVVELNSIGRRRFRALLADHPARMVEVDDESGKKDQHPDDGLGVNTETFPAALLTFVDGDYRTIATPKMTPGECRDFIDDELVDGDFQKLWLAAYFLNRNPGADPSQSRYSVGHRSTETTSI